MNSPQQPKSNKLESLPKDLRKIADQLIADKFPDDVWSMYDGLLKIRVDKALATDQQILERYYNGKWVYSSVFTTTKPTVKISTLLA